MPIQSAALFLTENCNLRCRYCYVPKQPRDMPLEVGRDVIEFMLAAPSSVKRVSIYFFGGEPLLRFETLKTLVEYGKSRSAELDKPIHFGVTTNGVLLVPDVLNFLRENKISINLSMDGGPETQNANRCMADGSGSFERIDAVLDHVLESNPKQGIRMTFDAQSVGRLHENIQFFWRRGFLNVSPAPVIEDAWTEATLAEAASQYRRVAESVLDEMRQGRYRRIGYLHKHVRRIASAKSRPKRQCGAGTSYVGVSVDGDIYPCHRFVGYGRFKFGSIDELTHPESRETFLTFDSSRITGCDDCRARVICAGGCPAANFAVTQDVYKPAEVLCAFMRMFYDTAHWLYTTLKSENNPLLEKEILRRRKPQRETPVECHNPRRASVV